MLPLCFSCTVVLFNPRKNTQAHVLNACRKTVTSLALAGDGRFLATGECGHMPNVRVWDISDPYNAVQFAEFSGHKYGINCVVSSKRGKPATCSQKSVTIDYARIVKTKPEKLRSGECSERIDESFFLLIDRLINYICVSFAISLTVSASACSIVNQILSPSLSLPRQFYGRNYAEHRWKLLFLGSIRRVW